MLTVRSLRDLITGIPDDTVVLVAGAPVQAVANYEGTIVLDDSDEPHSEAVRVWHCHDMPGERAARKRLPKEGT